MGNINFKQHASRVFQKFWLIIVFLCFFHILFGLGLYVVLLIISLLFFNNIPEKKNPEDYFSKEEWEMIQSGETSLDDEEYLSLLARFQTFECPVKVDDITTWTSSELTKDSFICHYEINDKKGKYGDINPDTIKKTSLNSIDKEGYKVQRIVATNRNMILRYWNCQTEKSFDVILTNEELKVDNNNQEAKNDAGELIINSKE